MVFNGLTKSDLVVFNALLESDLSKPVPISELSRLTCYHSKTISRALDRLVGYDVITRWREDNAKPYQYHIRENGYVVLDT